MIHFHWLWAFLLLPLPWLVRRHLKPAEPKQQASLWVPFLDDFFAEMEASSWRRARRWPLWVAVLAWMLLVTALARPQWLGEPVQLPVSGRDLMLAVDLSGSMQEEDFIVERRRVDRLTATKYVAGEFIDRRVGDRIGLILFGEQAYLQTPLSFDRETVKTLLYESAIGLAGKATAIGDAIGQAVKRLSRNNEGHHQGNEKVLILITDGANTAGAVEPLKAARIAAAHGLTIYTIGIGADEMMVRSVFGTRRVNPSVDLDEDSLKQIAETTGGRYFRARDTAELGKIYSMLDELEPIEKDQQSFRPRAALYPWPLALAMLFASGLLIRRLYFERAHY